ncbi:MAG: class II fructose-bisphosphate aldolase [Armatimonadetes bacterium]|nr:class II fructose-bisphosphate aldolase [Armatimonadota bacterium]
MQLSSNLEDTIRVADRAGIAVPAFNIPYLPMMRPVAEALEEHDTFGMIQVARPEFTKFEAGSIAQIAAEYRRVANPAVATLHLDHIPVIDEDGLHVDWKPLIAEGISEGYDSVMIDASRLPFEENLAVTAEVVEMAHGRDVLVEAELGSVLGHEAGPLPPYEELFSSRRGFTDPGEAREFVARTGVDWLSVSVGSVHGAISEATKDQPKVRAKLDIEHLKLLREAAGVPLVLHGGSGIELPYIRAAVQNGIAKINIGTDIRQPYERTLAAGGTVENAQSAVREVITETIRDKYCIEGSASRLREIVGGGL